MRVHLNNDRSVDHFSKILFEIGNGEIPFIERKINIVVCLSTIVFDIGNLTDRIYPDIKNIKEKYVKWLCERAILTPKDISVLAINKYILNSFENNQSKYSSV